MNEIMLADLLEQIKELNKNITNINKQAFNASEAADYLTISYDTILRLARIGRIEHVKNGTSYIFKKEHLDRWLDSNVRRLRNE